ncbi:hypothetical protein [Methanobrevibacter sp.]
MSLKVDTESEDYQFYKTLNEDVELIPNRYGKYDLNFENDDYVNVTGKKSLYNAIVIAIMTRFNELGDIPLYEEFGCRVHELLKDNKSDMVMYEIELYIRNVLENMRRILEVNEIKVTENPRENYHVYFNVTSINDEIVAGEMDI